MSSIDDPDRFLANPGEYFGYSLTRLMTIPRDELAQVHRAGTRLRFKQLRGRLPMLDRLADSQDIKAIDEPTDVVPLLFDHATYKSYPTSLLDNHRYDKLTAWLGKLTTIDLSHLDMSSCRSIDDWMIKLSKETPMAVVHTSGTSGRLSFLPWSKKEWLRFIGQHPVYFFQEFGKPQQEIRIPMNIPCVYPYFRSGGMSHTVLNDALVQIIAGREENFHAAYPGRISADLLLLAAKLRAAEARGQSTTIEISPEMAHRRKEFEAQQRGMQEHVANFFSTMRTTLAGKQVFIEATSNMLVSLAESGMKQGMKRIFSPTTVILTGGGGKGVVLPDNWQETVEEFFGTKRISVIYGMSEMGGLYTTCELGHYHAPPWVIAFLLDPETGKLLPSVGTKTGRFAFFDLLPETRWGGFISGDEVTMDWDTLCSCGRTTPFIVGKIQRVSEKRTDQGEEKISCAATPAAYADALDFLNDTGI